MAPQALLSEDDNDTGSNADLQDLGRDTVHIPGLHNGGDVGGDGTANEGELVASFEDDAGQQNGNDGQQQAGPQQADDERVVNDDNRDGPQIGGRRDKNRHQRRRDGKDRSYAENLALKAELEDLRSRMDGLDPRFQQMDEHQRQTKIADLDRQTQSYADIATRALQSMSEAVVNGDGPAHSKALQDYTKATMDGNRVQAQLNLAKTGSITGDDEGRVFNPQPRQQGPQRQEVQGPVITAVGRAYTTDFLKENPWFVGAGKNDLDSDMLALIDSQVAQEYSPNTPDYWEELRDRAAQYLPHRFANDGVQPQRNGAGNQTRQQPANGRANSVGQQPQPQQRPAQQRRGPAVGGGGEGAGAPRVAGNAVRIDKGRRQALQDMGVLAADGQTVNDPARYQRMLKQYKAYDTQNGAG